MSALLWLSVPLTPLLAGFLLLHRPTAVAPYLWLACLPALLAALVPPPDLPLAGLWPGAHWGITDAVGRAFLGFTALLWACASLFATGSLQQDPHARRFWICWLLSFCGNLLLVIALDGTSFYVGFTLMSLAAYGLVVHRGGPGPRQAGRLYLQIAVLGEMLLYAALLLRTHEAGGHTAFHLWQSVPVGSVTAALLLIGFGFKAGFWPLHVWLPLAHPAAPAAASAVLSGAMIKAGILGLWRFLPNADPVLQSWAPSLFIVGLCSAFFGIVLGLMQRKAKAALAYSSISQMGYLLALLAAAWLMPEQRLLWAGLLVLYTVHHGLAKGALFMGAGLASSRRLRIGHWLLLALPAAALAGIPLSSGGAIKALVKAQFADTVLQPAIVLLSVGSLGTALLMARALWLMRRPAHTDPPPRLPELCGWVPLCLMPILLPWLWPALRAPLFDSLTLATTLSLLWPLAAAAVIALLAARSIRLPDRVHHLPNPGRRWSLVLRRQLQRLRLPSLPPLHTRIWRWRERRWNRFWRSDAITTTAGLLLVALLAILLVTAL